MMELTSLAYRKMGLPEDVNLKYRDFEQARLAIDAAQWACSARWKRRYRRRRSTPYRSTLANLQMNYARLASQAGKD